MVGGTGRSLQELSAEVATNPNSTAFVELAAAYRDRGDLRRALWLCLRGLQRHPTHVEAHFELARIYEERGERELALDELGIVRQLAPDHVSSRLALIQIYLEEGRRGEAERELHAADELAPQDPALARIRMQLKASGPVSSGGSQNVFDALVEDYPGTLGALLLDREGQVVAGRMRDQQAEADGSLAANLGDAREEANRVASYLQLGELHSIVVEGPAARITVSPVEKNAIVVATQSDVPAGQATRVRQKAAKLAKAFLGGETK